MIKIGKLMMFLYSYICFFSIFRTRIIDFNTIIFGIANVLLLFLFSIKRRKIVCSRFCKKILRFFTIWVVYAVLSLFWCKDIYVWLVHIAYLLYGCYLIVISIYLLDNKDKIFSILGIFSLCYVLVALLGFIEILYGKYFFATGVVTTQIELGLPIVSFGNCNNLSTFLSFGIFVYIMYVYMFVDKKIFRYASYVLGFIPVILIFISGSRANILGLMFCVVGMGLILLLRRISFITIVLVLMLLVLFLAFCFSQDIMSFINNFKYGTSNYVRWNLIRSGFDILLNSWFFGVGAGNSNIQEMYSYDVVGIYNLHNWWIQIFAEYGLGIGIAYLVNFIVLTNKLCRIYKRRNKMDMVLSMCFLCIQLTSIFSLISPSGVTAFIWLWILWGIMIAFVNVCDRNINRRCDNAIY